MVTTVQISKFLSLVLLGEVGRTFSQLRKPEVQRYGVHISEKGNWATKDSLGRSKKERGLRSLNNDCPANQKQWWKIVKMMRQCWGFYGTKILWDTPVDWEFQQDWSGTGNEHKHIRIFRGNLIGLTRKFARIDQEPRMNICRSGYTLFFISTSWNGA